MLKHWAFRILNIVGSLLVFAALAEVGSRWLHPVPQVSYVDDQGQSFRSLRRDKYRLAANTRYHVRSREYDALATHTAGGYRGPLTSNNPQLLFIGDSFTYGLGLTDEQTFVYLFCHERKQSCVNLGRPGSGTFKQLDILEHYLKTEHWRPREVRLFMLAMTSAIGQKHSFGGNDLGDNLQYLHVHQNRKQGRERRSQISETFGTSEASETLGFSGLRSDPVMELILTFLRPVWARLFATQPFTASIFTARPSRQIAISADKPTSSGGWLAKLADLRRGLINNSNFVRTIYFYTAPFLRAHFTPPPDPQRLAEALRVTAEALQKLDHLSQHYGFKYRVYLLPPLADLTRGTWARSYQQIRAITPDEDLIQTAHLFVGGSGSASDYYFPYDGHFNPQGARKLADFLLSEQP